MNKGFKVMPLVMTVLSALYFIYILSSEDTVLMADAVGGDPGGKVLPMVMAIFMFLGSLYITVKERPDGEPMRKETKQLFFFTLLVSVLYVFLIRYVGFIILTTLLLFSLEYIYTTLDDRQGMRPLLYGCGGTVAVTVLQYFIMRIITKTLMSFGRRGVLPEIFTVSAFEACISLVYITVVAFLMNKTVCRKLIRHNQIKIANAGLLTVVSVLFLYVVFKQFFSVNLAPGILNF